MQVSNVNLSFYANATRDESVKTTKLHQIAKVRFDEGFAVTR